MLTFAAYFRRRRRRRRRGRRNLFCHTYKCTVRLALCIWPILLNSRSSGQPVYGAQGPTPGEGQCCGQGHWREENPSTWRTPMGSMGRTCKLHTERESNPGPSCCQVTLLSNEIPCSNKQTTIIILKPIPHSFGLVFLVLEKANKQTNKQTKKNNCPPTSYYQVSLVLQHHLLSFYFREGLEKSQSHLHVLSHIILIDWYWLSVGYGTTLKETAKSHSW